jgi:glycosyltransferase involved in cell wall biosynthesis
MGRVAAQPVSNAEQKFAPSGNALSIYLRMTLALRRIAASYDMVLANHSMTALPVALATASGTKRFYYVQAYETEYYELENGIKAKILSFLSALSYRLPLRQIANSPIYIGYRGIKASSWVPPGIDSSLFYRRRSSPFFRKDGSWTVGIIGRREPSKGTRYALDAFEKLAAIDPRVKLKVAFGNLPDDWSHERAEVVVPKNDAELADFYRSVDILVAPGTVQLGACHYPVLEAMAVGTPVITTGYLPANAENSWLVPIKNAEAIAAAMQEIAEGDVSNMQRKLDNAALAIKDFYWEEVAQRFLEIMKSS